MHVARKQNPVRQRFFGLPIPAGFNGRIGSKHSFQRQFGGHSDAKFMNCGHDWLSSAKISRPYNLDMGTEIFEGKSLRLKTLRMRIVKTAGVGHCHRGETAMVAAYA